MLVFIVSLISFLAEQFHFSDDASSFYMTSGQLTDRGKSAKWIQRQISAYANTFMASVLNFSADHCFEYRSREGNLFTTDHLCHQVSSTARIKIILFSDK